MKSIKLIAFLITAFAGFVTAPALADDAMIYDYPTNWRLQNYENNSQPVTLWYTGSNCDNGHLILPASATEEDRQRLFSLILTAKAANQKVGVFYDSSTCVISSFYAQ